MAQRSPRISSDRPAKLTIAELIAQRQDGNDLLIHQVKDLLLKKLGCKFGVDTLPFVDPPMCLVTYVETGKIGALQDKILQEFGGKLSFQFKPNGYTKVMLNEVDVSILDDQDKLQAQREVEADLSQQFARMNLGGAPGIQQPGPLLTKKNLGDEQMIPVIKSHIQAISSLNELMVENTGVLRLVLSDFSKYRHIAQFLLYESICRGDRNCLQTIIGIQVQGKVDKEKTTMFTVFYPDRVKVKTHTQKEDYQYLIQANFDAVDFAKYMLEKRSSASEPKFLGIQEDVEACINTLCGEQGPRAKTICQKLATLNAYKTLENMFDFGF